MPSFFVRKRMKGTPLLTVVLIMYFFSFDVAYAWRLHKGNGRNMPYKLIRRGPGLDLENGNHRHSRLRRDLSELQNAHPLNLITNLTPKQEATASVMAEKLEQLLVPEMENEIETIGNLVYNAILEDQQLADEMQKKKSLQISKQNKIKKNTKLDPIKLKISNSN